MHQATKNTASTPVAIPILGHFDPTERDAITGLGLSPLADLPVNGIATFTGHARLIERLEGRLELTTHFDQNQVTGEVSGIIQNNNGQAESVAGMLFLTGKIVSRRGIRLDIAGQFAVPDKGMVAVEGVLRGTFMGPGAAAIVATLAGQATYQTQSTTTFAGQGYARATAP